VAIKEARGLNNKVNRIAIPGIGRRYKFKGTAMHASKITAVKKNAAQINRRFLFFKNIRRSKKDKHAHPAISKRANKNPAPQRCKKLASVNSEKPVFMLTKMRLNKISHIPKAIKAFERCLKILTF